MSQHPYLVALTLVLVACDGPSGADAGRRPDASVLDAAPLDARTGLDASTPDARVVPDAGLDGLTVDAQTDLDAGLDAASPDARTDLDAGSDGSLPDADPPDADTLLPDASDGQVILRLEASGGGSVHVVSDPPGLDCAPPCQALFPSAPA